MARASSLDTRTAHFLDESLELLSVLVLDCQASGASPAHGDLIELGWAWCSGAGLVEPARCHFVVPRTDRPVRRAVRELTGWSEACLADSLDEHAAWRLFTEDAARLATPGQPAASVIHFARFELGFLHDLHHRLSAPSEFPLDVVCLHAMAARLFPNLPRRSIRALAGYLGHGPELLRRSSGHVEATAFIWRECLPLLAARGVVTWNDLKLWLGETKVERRPQRRQFPLERARRLALPPEPGVYRFERRNGDVLYVGKATSLKKRVASHFKSRGPATERSLELLSQVHQVSHVVTASALEAALLECDEIQRLDPPYNVQFRASADASAWFASRDLAGSTDIPDQEHRIGPLPSKRALAALAALQVLAGSDAHQRKLQGAALAVPATFLPTEALFSAGLSSFLEQHFGVASCVERRPLEQLSLRLWLERGRSDPEASLEQANETEAPNEVSSASDWDVPRIVRRLERNLIQAGLLLRRAPWLCLLAEATVVYAEQGMHGARGLVLSRASVSERHELEAVTEVMKFAPRPVPPVLERQRYFDKTAYHRMRVLLTELHRVADQHGDIAIRIGSRTLIGERLTRLLGRV